MSTRLLGTNRYAVMFGIVTAISSFVPPRYAGLVGVGTVIATAFLILEDVREPITTALSGLSPEAFQILQRCLCYGLAIAGFFLLIWGVAFGLDCWYEAYGPYGTLVTEARVLAGRECFDEAVRRLSEAIALAPKKPLAFYHRGVAQFARRKFQEAIQDFTNAVELNRKDKAARVRRCVAVMMARAQHSERHEVLEVVDEGIYDEDFGVFGRDSVSWDFVALTIPFQAACLDKDETGAVKAWTDIMTKTGSHTLACSIDECLSYSMGVMSGDMSGMIALQRLERKDWSPYLIFLKFMWELDRSERCDLVRSVRWFVRLFRTATRHTQDFLRWKQKVLELQTLIRKYGVRSGRRVSCPRFGVALAFVKNKIKLKANHLDHARSECFCEECLRGQDPPSLLFEPEDLPESRGCSFPRGWTRIGLRIGHDDVLSSWNLAYHGTKWYSVKRIVVVCRGSLLQPGDKLPSGVELSVCQGHIDHQQSPAKKEALKEFTKCRFVSPSLKYASEYAKKVTIGNYEYQVVFEVRIQPGSFKDALPDTLFRSGQRHTLRGSFDDPLFVAGECFEWFTDCREVIVLTGLLVKAVEKKKMDRPELQSEEEGEVARFHPAGDHLAQQIRIGPSYHGGPQGLVQRPGGSISNRLEGD